MKKESASFTDLLAIAFIVLKLCNVIIWNWFWVLSPVWGSIVFSIVLALLKKEDKKDKGMESISAWQKRMDETLRKNQSK